MAKKKRRRKNHYRLLLYDRFFSRYRIFSFLLFVSLLASWFAISVQLLVLPFKNISGLFLSGAILFFCFWLFTTLGPLFAFVQAHDEYLLLQTPLYQLKIPYHQILNTRPVEIRKIYPPSSISIGQRSLLGPYLGQTALAVDLQSFPPPSFSLRLFFHRLTISPEGSGIVLLVHDWMGLSNQLSVSVDTWRMARTDHPTHGASDAANILRDS